MGETHTTLKKVYDVGWYEDGDKPPYAVVEVAGVFDTTSLGDLIKQLNGIRNGMIWHMATYLHISSSTARDHLLRKADYEADQQCKTLCGQQPKDKRYGVDVSPLTFVPTPGEDARLFGRLSGHCQRCVSVWQRENPAPAEGTTTC